MEAIMEFVIIANAAIKAYVTAKARASFVSIAFFITGYRDC